MKSDPSLTASDLPVLGEDSETWYSLEVVAELAGLSTLTVLHYQKKGFIRPVSRQASDTSMFDMEDLRQLRRIEHLRAAYEVNEVGLNFILSLLHEVEHLRQERRQMLR